MEMPEMEMLYPNCSEATMRINLSSLNEKEIKKIENWLEETSNMACEKDYSKGPKSWQWDDTSFEKLNIFGKINVIQIEGQIPYNNGFDLIEEIKKIEPKLKEEDFEIDEN